MKLMHPLSLLAALLAVGPGAACQSGNSSSTPTVGEGPSIVTASDDDKPQILRAYRDMYRAMLEGRTDRLALLLDDQYSLTHITGYRQSKRDWLSAIDAGQMRYHTAQENSVRIDVNGDTAALESRSVVTATIYGARATWNLQLTTDYARKSGTWIATRTVATTF